MVNTATSLLSSTGAPRAAAGVWLDVIAERIVHTPADHRRWDVAMQMDHVAPWTDYLIAEHPRDVDPDESFDRLRWGGQMIFSSTRPRALAAAMRAYRDRPEFTVEVPPTSVERRRGWWRRPRQFFVVRKVRLIQPSRWTDRHSYDVRLTPAASLDPDQGWVVTKRVPTSEQAMDRLRHVLPGMDEAGLAVSARKLVQKVFPIFLTREAAFLKILQRDLPERFRNRVPRVLRLEKDARGLVQRLDLSWLRLGGLPISRHEFARQSAELLTALHDCAAIVHLDLRLDNYVITEHGVGFVDFGSSIRRGEDFTHNRLLNTLMHEMLSASRIRRDMKMLRRKGLATSKVFEGCYENPDRAIDLFYLALEMTRPHQNPDFAGLVFSEADQRLDALSGVVLCPPDPDRPRYSSARDVYRGITGEEPDVPVFTPKRAAELAIAG